MRVLSSLTKKRLLEYIDEYYDFEYDDKDPKLTIIEKLNKAIDDGLEPVKALPPEPGQVAPPFEPSKKVVGIEDIIAAQKTESKPKREVKEAFRPAWSPSYKHNGEYYMSLSPEVIHDWHMGRRDTKDTKTIAFWIERKGQLLVRNNFRKNFEYLR